MPDAAANEDADAKTSRPPVQTRRVKTPTILQMEAVECGCASLAMVLAHYGRWETLETLRKACGVSRDGSKALNILKAARTYGLQADGYRLEPAQLDEYPLPMILHWEFNHFVVLEGVRGRHVYINNPASGRQRLKWEEFDNAFTGVALVFQPTAEFSPGGKPPSAARSLARRLASSTGALLYVLAAGLLAVIPGLVLPACNTIFIDNVILKDMHWWLAPLLWFMAGFMVLALALDLLQQHGLLQLRIKLSLSGSASFFWRLVRLPIEFFGQRFAGDVATRVQRNDDLARLLTGELAVATVGLLTMTVYAVALAFYSLPLTAVGVGMALLNLAALRLVSRTRVDLNRIVQKENGKLMGTTMYGLQMIESLKASGGETDFFGAWAGYQAKSLSSQQRLNYSTQLLSVLPTYLNRLNQGVILVFGGFFVIQGQMTLGMLTAFQALMTNFMAPTVSIVNLGGEVQTASADLERLEDVLRNQEDPVFHTKPVEDLPPKLEGCFEMRGVTFGYSPLEPPLIENFTLTLAPGSRVALVGASGSGKSTVAKLGVGLHRPWSGEILLDGLPLERIPREVFANSVSMVSQTIFLFSGTVRDNLTMWGQLADDADMIDAAKDACIHDDIMARPGGYDAVTQEGGANFSGGQRQRLEIARSLAVNPSLLFLDEATSALDPPTERLIDSNIRRRGVTCVIVAHRLSTIRDADEIIVLERGKVVQRGTHDELMIQGGAYADLIKVQ